MLTRRARGAPVAVGPAGRVPRAAPGSPHPHGCRHGRRAAVGLVAVDPLGGAQIREWLDRRRGRGQPVGLRGGQPVVSQHIPGRLVVRAVGPVRGVRRGAPVAPRRDGRPGLPRRAAAGTAIRAGTRAQQIPRAPPLLPRCPVVPRSVPRLRESSGRRPGGVRGLSVRARPVGRGTGDRTGLSAASCLAAAGR